MYNSNTYKIDTNIKYKIFGAFNEFSRIIIHFTNLFMCRYFILKTYILKILK